MKRTPEEKKAYCKALRKRWSDAKKQLTEGEAKDIDIIRKLHGMNISRMGYFFCALQMKAQGLDGLPYVDCKTFKGWIDHGFQVRKGEQSTISGVTWVPVFGENDPETGEIGDIEFLFPREYRLFHRSQVQAA